MVYFLFIKIKSLRIFVGFCSRSFNITFIMFLKNFTYVKVFKWQLNLFVICTSVKAVWVIIEIAKIANQIDNLNVNINYSRNTILSMKRRIWKFMYVCCRCLDDTTLYVFRLKTIANIGWVKMIIIIYWDTFRNTHTTRSQWKYILSLSLPNHPSHILKLYFTGLRFRNFLFVHIFCPFSLKIVRRTHIDCIPYTRSIFQFPYKSVPFFHLELISCAKLFQKAHRYLTQGNDSYKCQFRSNCCLRCFSSLHSIKF